MACSCPFFAQIQTVQDINLKYRTYCSYMKEKNTHISSNSLALYCLKGFNYCVNTIFSFH